jgi:hypothetical protein
MTQDFELRNVFLRLENVDESHTTACLTKSLSDQTVAWTTESQSGNWIKTAVASDNAANIKAAMSKLPSCQSVLCFDHTLQLVIEDAVKSCDEIQTTINKAKTITTHFRHS